MEVYKRKVHYYETDQMAIVHHSNYIRWFEEARINFLDDIGLGMNVIEEKGVLIPVLSVTCNYRSMTRFNDTVCVGLRIEKYNGIKLQVSYRITDFATGELRTTGSSEHCFINNAGNVISLKKEMHKILLENSNVTTY